MSESIHAPKTQHAVSQATDASYPGLGDAHDSHTHCPLTSPVLYVSGVDSALTDKDVAATVFQYVLPIRPSLDRDPSEREPVKGTVEFESIEKAAKAYATIRAPILLRMSLFDVEPVPQARPRLVKHLPKHLNDPTIYDLFRPFGPIFRAQCVLTNPSGHYTGFKGVATVIFYSEQDAQCAQNSMHCADVEGSTISVTVDHSSAKRSNDSTATQNTSMSARAPAFDILCRNVSGGSEASIHAPKRQQPPSQTSAHIDPCNLFVKNLDADIDTDDLVSAFRGFGSVQSARIMRDEAGQSRGFGFVSYADASEASAALKAMDKAVLSKKNITVCVHEPKAVRQGRLAKQIIVANDDNSDTDVGLTAILAASTPVPGQRATSSPSSSSQAEKVSLVSPAAVPSKERERLLNAVTSICAHDEAVEDITDMLASLSRKDRALCLFNTSILTSKVEEARDILAMSDDTVEDSSPATPAEEHLSTQQDVGKSKSVPMTISALATLSAAEIIRIANTHASADIASEFLPLPCPDTSIVQATDAFIDGLADKSPQDQKQKLGEHLFKKVRSFGNIKGASKITIHLLDTEDLRSLAHLMNAYEPILRERVLRIAVEGISK